MAKFHSEQTHRTLDRMRSAEAKMKSMKAEIADLRRQLFRAEESARIANEELTARIVAHKQSGEAARARAKALQDDRDLWMSDAERWHALANAPKSQGFFARLGAHFGSPA